mgnify:CR=1 FL=1
MTKKRHRQISATVQVRRPRRPQPNEKTNFFFQLIGRVLVNLLKVADDKNFSFLFVRTRKRTNATRLLPRVKAQALLPEVEEGVQEEQTAQVPRDAQAPQTQQEW